jgi:hypothetical protein
MTGAKTGCANFRTGLVCRCSKCTATGQAQKEFLHNEAVQALEILVAPTVEEPPLAAPPSSPAPGSCYIVADSPTGAWLGRADYLAAFTIGGWRFVAPTDGQTVHVRLTGTKAIYREGVWELADGPIASPSGGGTVDAEARSAVDQILNALRQHGIIAS